MTAADNVVQFATSALDVKANRIRSLGKQAIENVIEVGQLLMECQGELKHGEWLPWLDREFQWTRHQADRFIHVYDLSRKLRNLRSFDWDISALYLIAAPGNAEIRDEVIAEVGTGRVKHQAVAKAVRERKKPTTKSGSKAKAIDRMQQPVKQHPRHAEVVRLADEGGTNDEIAKSTGLHTRQISVVLRQERTLREAERKAAPTVERKDLSATAQEKLDIARRAQERDLNAKYADRVRKLNEEVRQRVLAEGKEYLDAMKAREREAERLIAAYTDFIKAAKPHFTTDQFKLVLMCLHPDGVRTPEKLSEAFKLFNSKKLALTAER